MKLPSDYFFGILTVNAGKGLANPTALLLSSLMMLRCVTQRIVLFLKAHHLFRHMNLNEYANNIEKAALTVCRSIPFNGRLTKTVNRQLRKARPLLAILEEKHPL